MTVTRLARVKRWHLGARARKPIEHHCWDLVVALWLAGWFGLPAALLLGDALVGAACLAGQLAPTGYVRLRCALHRARWLRCDWLGAALRAA